MVLTNNATENAKALYKYAVIVTLEAKPGKEEEVSALLQSTQPFEAWGRPASRRLAFRTGKSLFGVFHMFRDEKARDEHLSGDAAGQLFCEQGDLFASPPRIESSEILSA